MTPPRAFLPRARLTASLSVVGLLAAGLLAVVPLRNDAMAQSSPPATAPAGPTIPVTVAAARRQDVPLLLRNIGSVQAFQSVLIRARVDGTLDKVFFEEGQDVKRGDPLALIDPRPYQAALAQAQAKRASDAAQLANAQRDLARYSNLVKNEFASRQQVDTQTSTVAQLTAALQGDDASVAAAQVNVDYTLITAPFDGHVGLRQVDPGNVIRAADPAGVGIVTITQIHPIAVIFTLPQDTLPAIHASMLKGKLPVSAYTSDDKTLLSQGTLLTTDNSIDPTTGTIKLKSVFENKDNKLWPGQFVNVRLQIDVLHNAVTVPSIAVQRSANGLFVYLLKPDSTVAVQPVEIGQDDGQYVVITKNLDEGAQVVTNGQSRLQNGTKVSVTQPKASS